MATNSGYVSRRRFTVTALSAGAALLSSNKLSAESAKTLARESAGEDTIALERDTNKSFASLKQIEAGFLKVGYAEAGPPNGPAVILLHGWPYDIYSFVDVAPLLATNGLQGHHSVSAGLWNDSLSLERNHT